MAVQLRVFRHTKPTCLRATFLGAAFPTGRGRGLKEHGATELPKGTTEPDVAEKVRKAYEIAVPDASFARAVAFAVSQQDVDVNEILFRPTHQEL